MDPAVTGQVLDTIDRLWGFAPDPEITLEANPGTAEAGRFAAFKAAGVNRLSLGIQSFDDTHLRFLGRVHDAAEACRAIDLAQKHFDRYSFDLIYGLPGQSADHWRGQLQTAFTFAPDHLSAYQLTIEKGTVFHKTGVPAAPEELGADLFDLTQEVLAAAGLPAYEVSNHARPGSECRHNLIYWRLGDWIGIGPGAHGRIGDQAIREVPKPETWLARALAGQGGTLERLTLSASERAEEMVMMGLRLVEGVDTDWIATRTGRVWSAVVAQAPLHELIGDGYLHWDGKFLKTTPKGQLILNYMLGMLLS